MSGRSPAFEPAAGEIAGRKRNSCKVLVQRDGKVLFTVNRDGSGDFLLLPGGGQRFGETLAEAAARETLEETGVLVEPRELVLVREYIGANHEFAGEDGDVHQTEFFFRAMLVDGDTAPSMPAGMDAWQTGTAWVDPGELGSRRIYPSILASILAELLSGAYLGPVYLGDTN